MLDFGLAKALARRRLGGPPRGLADHDPAGPERGLDPRHRRLHEPRAGARPGGRQAHRHLGLRLRPLRVLTGRKLFAGPSTSDSLAAVLTLEPDWTALPPRTPPLVRSLLRRCLEKDKDQRLRDIADARLEIEEALAEPSGAGLCPWPRRSRSRGGGATSWCSPWAALVGALGVWLGVRPRPVATSGARARLNIALPPDTPLLSELGGGLQTVALSADASRLAFVGRRPDGRQQIFLRRMESLSPDPVAGTEDGACPSSPPTGSGWASRRKASSRRSRSRADSRS